MVNISIGAVGAAIIAGLVSVLGLIIGKEQKISEFRQAWINDLRNCLISYLVNINNISDLVRTRRPGVDNDQSSIISAYKALNEASNGIKLRINKNEKDSEKLIEVMLEFEHLAEDNSRLTPENIRVIEERFLKRSRKLLKFEWKRVKKGEPAFIWTKRAVILTTLIMVIYFFLIAYGLWNRHDHSESSLLIRALGEISGCRHRRQFFGLS